jgi:hypothetical protein
MIDQSPTRPHDGRPAPLIITATMGAADFSWANALRQLHYAAERNLLPAHISLFRHLPPSLGAELKVVLAQAAKAAPPPAFIDSPVMFGEAVVIPIHSPGLMEVRAEMAERFSGLLTPQDRAEPRLHITVQNKVARAVGLATLAELSSTVQPRPLHIAGLACWRYLGGPWELVARYAFRGRGRSRGRTR